MKKGTHGITEKTFAKLEPKQPQQSRAINCQIQGVFNSIRANVRELNDEKKQHRKDVCIKLLENCITKIRQL